MTDEELKKIYYPIAECWKLIRTYRECTGTDKEADVLLAKLQQIFEKSGKTEFAKRIVFATGEEIDRIMMENKNNEEKI